MEDEGNGAKAVTERAKSTAEQAKKMADEAASMTNPMKAGKVRKKQEGASAVVKYDNDASGIAGRNGGQATIAAEIISTLKSERKL
ncbi:MAG: hypothetical protein ACI4TW_08330 [Prevotella sp.]